MRVLIAVDGSAGSFEAIDQIAPLLRPDRDEVALYCHPPHVQVRSSNVAAQLVAGAQESIANTIFSEARKRLPATFGEKTRTIAGHQDPRRGINVAAQQWSADLIVIGARGLGVIKRLLLGSVSRAVVHAADIPVWVARPRSGDAKNGLRVLLASESPESAQRPAELLGQLAWPQGTDLAIMTVIYSVFAGRVPDWLRQQARSPDVEEMVQVWVREHDEEIRANVARMKGFIESLSPQLRSARPMVTEGEPADSIMATAAREKTDLIVVGTRQKWSMGSAILGSVSEAVLNHAGCSVLVVPRLVTP